MDDADAMKMDDVKEKEKNEAIKMEINTEKNVEQELHLGNAEKGNVIECDATDTEKMLSNMEHDLEDMIWIVKKMIKEVCIRNIELMKEMETRFQGCIEKNKMFDKFYKDFQNLAKDM